MEHLRKRRKPSAGGQACRYLPVAGDWGPLTRRSAATPDQQATSRTRTLSEVRVPAGKKNLGQRRMTRRAARHPAAARLRGTTGSVAGQDATDERKCAGQGRTRQKE